MKFEKIKLGTLCALITKGTTPTTIGHRFTDSGVAFVKVESLTEDGQIDPDKLAYIDLSAHEALKRSQLKAGDILFTIAGTIGRVGKVPDAILPANTNQAVALIRPNPETLDGDFLLYSLRQLVNEGRVASRVVQAVQANFSLGSIRELELFLPRSTEEQRKVVGALRLIDAKINVSRRINQTVEALAQAIFKSWFVDFDPVRAKIAAKAEGRDPLRAAMSAISGKTDAELDTLTTDQHAQLAATAAMFPDGLEDSELGEIPKGWQATPFGSMLTHTIGGDWGSDTPDAINDTMVAIIRGTDLPDIDQAQSNRVPVRYTSQKKLASRRLQIGDIVLEVSGGSRDQPTGRSIRMTANAMREFDCPVEPASFCRLLRPANLEAGIVLGLHLSYIYRLGKTWEYQNQSTGIANFQTTHFLEAELVAKPQANVLEAFYKTVNPLLERRHDPQSRQLAELRDTLLPKLLSGELSVTANEVKATT